MIRLEKAGTKQRRESRSIGDVEIPQILLSARTMYNFTTHHFDLRIDEQSIARKLFSTYSPL